ncbi:MAG: hypothetical protein ACLRTM_20710 [Clostridium sp.]
MLLRKQHLASQSDVVFIKRVYGALYAARKGHRSFPGRGRSRDPHRLGASWVERSGWGTGEMDRDGWAGHLVSIKCMVKAWCVYKERLKKTWEV